MAFSFVLGNRLYKLSVVTATIPALTTLAPRAQPTASVDPWECITESLAQYLDVPKPTGSLFDELQSYAAELYEPCLAAITIEQCPFPGQSDWCAFTTAAPAAILPAYSAYASQAYSWWATRSSTLSFLTEDCPNVWHSILLNNAGSEEWLNDTIAFAGCYADALTTATSSPTAPAVAQLWIAQLRRLPTRQMLDIAGWVQRYGFLQLLGSLLLL
ncbi:hypothetical protein O988_00121 [Pseudogymnoascus sp. VKM F-3808]|nr:hypothetical protein O988_00121 [Pseudogymnoascus sp. VKM F-3808]